jgi:RimJ/RimL family protein N-acetyltransferase
MANRPTAPAIAFRRLTDDDVPLMHRWLNQTAIKRWWDDSTATLEQVRDYYGPAIRGDEPTQPFVIELDGRPVGYIQSYRPEDWPDYWGRQALPPNVAGIDLFIGEDDARHRGFGPLILDAFIAELAAAGPSIAAVMVDPDPANLAAIRAYEKAGFFRLREIGPPEHGERALLMLRRIDRTSNGDPANSAS